MVLPMAEVVNVETSGVPFGRNYVKCPQKPQGSMFKNKCPDVRMFMKLLNTEASMNCDLCSVNDPGLNTSQSKLYLLCSFA
jgi:hypothetical protein